MNKEQITKIIKNKNNLTIFLIFIIGVVLMIVSGGHKTAANKTVNQALPATAEEERLENILSEIKGVGEVSVMITYAADGESGEARPRGVVIAAEGADNAQIKTAIHEAAMASLDVSAHRICIFKKEEE